MFMNLKAYFQLDEMSHIFGYKVEELGSMHIYICQLYFKGSLLKYELL